MENEKHIHEMEISPQHVNHIIFIQGFFFTPF